MPTQRIPIRLVADTPVDQALVATLNRFHFTRIRLTPEAGDVPYTLAYGEGPAAPDTAAVHMPRAEAPATADSRPRPLGKDYFQAIGAMLDRYLSPPGGAPDKSIAEAWQKHPAADDLADAFEQDVLDALELDIPAPERPFGLAMTHDVDCVGRHMVSNVKSGGVFLVNALRTAGTPASAPFLRSAARFLAGRVDYFGFQPIMDAAQRLDFRPTFLLYAKLPGANGLSTAERLKQVNPNYDLGSPPMRRALELIKQGGGEIGLHGSYRSPADARLLAREKQHLEETSGQACVSIRQHFLRTFGRPTLQAYEDVGIGFDSTCGFVYDNGYLCGTCRPFYAPGRHTSPGVVVVPMVFMDAVPLYFRPAQGEDVTREMRGILATLQRYGGFAAANFHQRMVSALPGVRALYEETIAMARGMGGTIAPLHATDSLFPPG